MIRLPRRRRVNRRNWMMPAHPMARIPHESFFEHLNQQPEPPTTWSLPHATPHTDTTTARGNR